MCGVDDIGHRSNGAQGIRDLGNSDQLGMVVQQFAIFLEQFLAPVIDRNYTQLRASLEC